MPVALVQLVHHECAQLVGSIVGAALRLAEPNLAGRDTEDSVPVRLGDGDVRVVLMAEDVEVEGLIAPVCLLLTRLPEDILRGGLVQRSAERISCLLLRGPRGYRGAEG